MANKVNLLEGMTKNAWIVTLTSLFGFTLVTVDGQFFSMVFPIIQKALSLPGWAIGVIVTTMGIVSCVAVLIGGPLIDYVGRKKVFQWTILFTALGSALTALSSGFLMLIIARAITTGGSTAEWMCGQVMVSEGTPAKSRGFWIGIAQAGWPLGIFVSAGMVILLMPHFGWRGVFWSGLIPIAVLLVARFTLKESDRYNELAKVRESAKNKNTNIETRYDINQEEAVQFTYKQLFLPDLRKTTVLFVLEQALYNYGLFCVAYFIPLIALAHGFTIQNAWSMTAWSSAFGALGYMSSGLFGNIYGRKQTCLTYLAIGGVFGCLTAFASHNVTLMTVWYSGYLFFTMGHMGSFVGFTLESFPTRARGTGASLVSFGTWFGLVMAGATSQIFVHYMGVEVATFIWLGLLSWVAFCLISATKTVKPGLSLEEVIV